MDKGYKLYQNVTREILDSIKVGDLVKVNDWDAPLTVKAVSDNYFVMSGNSCYSVCSKIPWDGVRHNEMVGGMFHCGPDDRIFGSMLQMECEDLYKFNNDDYNQKYLQEFEDGNNNVSERNGIAIYSLYVQSGS